MEVVSRKSIFRGGAIELVEDTLKSGDKTFRREVLLHPGAVVLLPLLGEEIVFVRQYRHAAGKVLCELPAGTLEPGEEPAAAAERELREETGFRPGSLISLGHLLAAPGYSSEVLHFFVARQLQPDPLPTPEEEGIDVLRIGRPRAIAQALEGGFEDSKTVLALLWFAAWLDRQET